MLIAFPSHDVIWDATLTSANEDPEYPIENVQNNDTADTAKSTTTTDTIEIATGGDITPVALFLGNTNWLTATLTNSAGLNASFTFPSRTPDGKQWNGWLDLRELANVTDDEYELALSKTGAAVGELGRIAFVTAFQAPEVLVSGSGQPPTYGHRRPGMVENITKGGTTHRRITPWAAPRRVTISCLDPATLAILRQLEAECNGLGKGFLIIPNDDVNDAWFAQCAFADFEHAQDLPDDANDILPVRMTIHEIAMGLPPELT